jgi:two-component system sensor histidine kinase BaeS
MNNAIKYTGNGGEVMVSVARNGRQAMARVADTGIGIPADELHSIFDKYYRARHARSLVGAGGAGIGLTIARDIVENHGGTLTVESQPGRGSTFTVTLPTE